MANQEPGEVKLDEGTTDPELATDGQFPAADSATIETLTEKLHAGTSPYAMAVAMEALVREQAKVVAMVNVSLETFKQAVVANALAYVRAYRQRALLLASWREGLHKVVGQDVVADWESRMGMALGSTSPRSIRRWIREAKDPPSWWNLIEAEATLTEGRSPPSQAVSPRFGRQPTQPRQRMMMTMMTAKPPSPQAGAPAVVPTSPRAGFRRLRPPRES